MILNDIQNPNDIKKLDFDKLNNLSDEIKELITNKVFLSGGHLSSNLSVIKLTIALFYVFDLNKDKVIFDVGHQSYAYKILSGRLKGFLNLRDASGIAGFPKINESKYDSYNSGHASTSIAIASGLRYALSGDSEIISIIGDGALSGGLSFESLNNLSKDKKQIIIINNNNMSIDNNIGMISNSFLNQSDTSYISTIANELGIKYIKNIDGDSIVDLIKNLKLAKDSKNTIILHVNNIKGRGLKIAENLPADYHGVSSDSDFADYTKEISSAMDKLLSSDKKAYVISPAMLRGSNLLLLKEKYPDRVIDVGISEDYAVTLAGGMALAGLHPYVFIYSTFISRAMDSIIHDVVLQKTKITLMIDRAGLVAYDGETHQGILDTSLFSAVDNIEILSPVNKREIYEALEYSQSRDSIIVIRYPKAIDGYGDTNCFDGKTIRLYGNDNCEKIIITLSARLNKTLIDLASEIGDCSLYHIRSNKNLISQDLNINLKNAKKIYYIDDNYINSTISWNIYQSIIKINKNIDMHIKGISNIYQKALPIDKLLKENHLDKQSLIQFINEGKYEDWSICK